MGRVLVGTSGFQYRHWHGILYPEGLPLPRWLARYAEAFATVELNATFYRLPSPAAVDRWRDGTPAGFVFAVKGSRYLTHVKRLREARPGIQRFFEPVLRFGPKLGPVLWQLPPQQGGRPRSARGLPPMPPPRGAPRVRVPERNLVRGRGLRCSRSPRRRLLRARPPRRSAAPPLWWLPVPSLSRRPGSIHRPVRAGGAAPVGRGSAALAP